MFRYQNEITKELFRYLNDITKELSFCSKLKFSNPHICATKWFKPLIFQTLNIYSNRIRSLKYLRFTRLDCKDIRIRKSEFMAKTQFLLYLLIHYITYINPLQVSTIVSLFVLHLLPLCSLVILYKTIYKAIR